MGVNAFPPPSLLSEIEISPLRSDDIESLLRIERLSYHDPWPRHSFLYLLRCCDAAWGAFSGGKLVGYIFAYLNFKGFHILNLAISPRFRRRGIARMLLIKLEARAMELNCPYIWLEVRIDNAPAVDLYLKEGFKVIRRLKSFYGKGRDGQLMIKRLMEYDPLV